VVRKNVDCGFIARLESFLERGRPLLVKIVPIKHIDAKEVHITKTSDQMNVLVVLSDGTEITITTKSWTIVEE